MTTSTNGDTQVNKTSLSLYDRIYGCAAAQSLCVNEGVSWQEALEEIMSVPEGRGGDDAFEVLTKSEPWAPFETWSVDSLWNNIDSDARAMLYEIRHWLEERGLPTGETYPPDSKDSHD